MKEENEKDSVKDGTRKDSTSSEIDSGKNEDEILREKTKTPTSPPK